MERWKRCRFAAVLLALLVLFSASVSAENLEERLQELQNRMEEERGRANEADTQVQTISEQLRLLQNDLDQAEKEYAQVRQQLDETEEKIAENTVILAEAERKLDKRMQVLSRRVRDIYKNGQISYIDVLFGAKDFNDLMTRFDLLKRVIQHDFNLIMEVKKERELILSKRAELERDKASIEVLERQADEKRQVVEESRARKQAVLDKAVNDRDTAERAYQELLEASRQVQALIRQSQYRVPEGARGKSTGTMIWPIHGVITSEYGWRTHPIFGTSKYHSGLDIAGDYGMPILAADSGVVIYAGWISGYGNAVIIDHGGGITTLYGHNDSLTVSEGQSVAQGQQIANCGSTGYSTGPHCHFEVRENGSPVSPYNYLQ